jgi:hypothetical protein
MREAVAHAQRTAERKHGFALPHLRVGGERQRRQLEAVHLQQREIELGGDADDARRDQRSPRRKRGGQRAVGVIGRHRDLDALRAGDHVRVGHDVALGIDDEARAHRSLAAENNAGDAAARFFANAVAGDENLHDARPDFPGQRVDRVVHPGQVVRRRHRLLRRGGRDDRRDAEKRTEDHRGSAGARVDLAHGHSSRGGTARTQVNVAVDRNRPSRATPTPFRRKSTAAPNLGVAAG